MLAWLRNLTAVSPRLEIFPDAIALRRAAALAGLRRAIQQRRGQDPLILLVAHFPTTFFDLQDALDAWGESYEIPTQPLRPQQVPLADADQSEARLVLVLSEMLEVETGLNAVDRRQTISVMVGERHLLPTHDQRVESFARQLPHPAKLGYFLAMDDPAVAPFAGVWAVELLRQWGMGDVDLITSDLVTRRLNRARQWLEKQVTVEVATDSPRQWLIENGAQTRYAQAIESFLSQDPDPSSSDD